ncbi:WD40/YVTN repeat-like-containing domain and WD40-repeat-containing domain-containing protein [Strongyloides ratti]|uniref:WD40/YVTN repeat-like-containing domain and WD40-repeat-containing domain-containing protein n=1 Tax=Strongyloides ratti TaxID=34506 RepID=A0A090LEN6_STRRB|nr:WD40/YVTN repeat-like-containing domain and WD40-repeat-containing domain-containing protein [Strongyloides ratti]CEF66618.1 WD40/YVTN repeat-like-containing domain and WD40-repeat-containing domain-containing protein [Strongyloides ratti]
MERSYIFDNNTDTKISNDSNIINNYNNLKNINHEPYTKTISETFFSDNIHLFDYHNGYLLTVSFGNVDHFNSQFLKIFNIDTGNLFYSEKLDPSPCTVVTFNKHNNEAVEFAIGYKSGKIKKLICYFNFNKLFIDTTIYNEKKKIHSICFFKIHILIYSIGNGNLIIIDTNENVKQTNWSILNDNEKGVIKNLKKGNEYFILGMIKSQMYSFKEDTKSHKFCQEVNGEVIDYHIDYTNNLYFIEYIMKKKIKKKEKKIKSYPSFNFYRSMFGYSINELEKYKKMSFYDNDIFKCLLKKENQFALSFNSFLFEIEDKNNFDAFSFIQNILCKILKNVNIFVGRNKQPKKLFNGIDECLEIFCLKTPNLLIPNILKMKLLLVFKDNFKIIEFYYPILE